MSIHELTCDEFFLLDAAHHRLALRLYTTEIDQFIDCLAAMPDKKSPTYAATRDELGQLLTLRKVHQVRLDELETEVAPVPALAPLPAPLTAMLRYEQNDREPALA